jgi:hypothetical protein
LLGLDGANPVFVAKANFVTQLVYIYYGFPEKKVKAFGY